MILSEIYCFSIDATEPNIYYPDNVEYFIEKLGIKLFPAIVTQDGDRVKISEIILN